MSLASDWRDPLPKFGGQARCPLGLAGAVFLDLLVGIVAVQFDDALAAADLADQFLSFRRTARPAGR